MNVNVWFSVNSNWIHLVRIFKTNLDPAHCTGVADIVTDFDLVYVAVNSESSSQQTQVSNVYKINQY